MATAEALYEGLGISSEFPGLCRRSPDCVLCVQNRRQMGIAPQFRPSRISLEESPQSNSCSESVPLLLSALSNKWPNREFPRSMVPNLPLQFPIQSAPKDRLPRIESSDKSLSAFHPGIGRSLCPPR